MNISRQEFDQKIADKNLVLTFIGMSGIGKTYFAKILGRNRFWYLSCDDLIAPLISKELKNVTDVGLWLGQPYSEGYKERERRYLEIEARVTDSVLSLAKGNTVVDTTGSVVYIPGPISKKLKEHSLMVYFKAEPHRHEEMLARYLSNPKPVIWGDSFIKKEGESNDVALKRCYPELLHFRAARYEELADVTLKAETIWKAQPNAEGLLQSIREALR